MEKCDVLVTGGGPGGYLAAERAAVAGKKTMVIEKREFGGVCLNEGCIPSKSFLQSAKVLEYVRHAGGYGVKAECTPAVDQAEVVKRKQKVVRTLVAGVKAQLKSAGVTMVKGEAFIEGKTEEGFTVKCGEESYLAENLIVATGSSPVVPPIKGLKEGLEAGFVLTNREVLDLKVLPESMVIIGGGVIGLEMAAYYGTVGSKITVVEMMNKIAGPTDKKASDALQTALSAKGIDFRLGCAVTEITEDGVKYTCGDEQSEIKAEKVLLCIGRRAVTQGFGLENLGVELNRGAIVTDLQMRTNVPNLYAVGDVNGKIMLAHTAYREAETAVNTILGVKDEVRYNCVPSVIYTVPEIASVGETEESALSKGLNIKVNELPMTYSGRYVAENNTKDGFIRLIINVDTNKLIGAQIVGSYAGEIISSVTELIDLEVDFDRIGTLIFPHPTVCEIIHEAIHKH